MAIELNTSDPIVAVPKLAFVANRFVDDAVVANELVDVELVVVELSPVKFWRDVEPVTKSADESCEVPLSPTIVVVAVPPTLILVIAENREVEALVAERSDELVLQVKAESPPNPPKLLNWICVPEPPGEPLLLKQVPLIAKHPPVILIPPAKLDVAVDEENNVPAPSIEKRCAPALF